MATEICTECQKPIEGDYLVMDKAHIHPECLLCHSCRKPIVGEVQIRGGKRLCGDCSAGMCFACDGPMPESKRNFIEDKCFHLGCMSCRRCSVPLVRGGGHILGKMLLCEKHHAEAIGGETFNPLQGCAKCGEKITSKVLLAMKKQWHRECFVCGYCQQPLTAQFYDHDEIPYCYDDFNTLFGLTCGACDEQIYGKYFLLSDKKYHEHCITCAICTLPLKPGEAVFMPGKKMRVHVGCVRCAGCSMTFDPRDPCFMRSEEPVAFCVDCKHSSKSGELKQLAGAVVMNALEGSSSQSNKPTSNGGSGSTSKQLYQTPQGMQPIASASEMAEFGNKMKLLNEILVEDEAKYAGKTALSAAPAPVAAPSKGKRLEMREDSPWVATPDSESGDVYFVNTVDGSTTWDLPSDFGGKVVDAYGASLDADEIARVLEKLGFDTSPEAPPTNTSLEPLTRPPEKLSLTIEILRYHMVTPLSAVHLDRLRLEEYLTDLAFVETLGVNRDEFGKLPLWKCERMKREANLFF